ncbi:MAG: hypothetical protein HY647_05865 [Acidobacteria bacterium]|nr:hypothetical protein [Acidobacteriota bacterium]
MATSESLSDMRRSTRLALTIPVEVSGRDTAGKPVREKAATKLVNKHGACVLLKHFFAVGAVVTLRVPHLDRQQQCHVVSVAEKEGSQSVFETGLELEHAENFWDIQFPPEDWTVPKRTPLAGAPSESPSSDQSRSPDPHWLGAMLNAIVAVLEDKGILSRAEISEKLKRMH